MKNSSFYQLNPDLVLAAAEAAGLSPTGEFTQLNSYENRVFDLRLEGSELSRVIAKFYRPQRWNQEALLEEHQFLFELEKEGLTVAPPLLQKNGRTLNQIEGLYCAFFAKVLGRMPQEFLGNDLKDVGKKLALLHNVGSRKNFLHRPVLAETPWTPQETLEFLAPWVRPEVWPRYETAADTIIEALQNSFDPKDYQRIHGDCHRGNLLHNGREFFFVDFDDCCMGPPVQDFWMLFSSLESPEEEELLISGYEESRHFPHQQMHLIPLLRGWRILSYAAWIARRWEDPSFPRLFPSFNTYQYWAEEVEALEQIAWTLS